MNENEEKENARPKQPTKGWSVEEFRRIIAEHNRRLFFFVRATFRIDMETTEEVVQDVFFALWNRSPIHDDADYLRNWLFDVARKRSGDAIDRANAQKRKPPGDREPLDPAAAQAPDIAVAVAAQEHFAQCLEKLTPTLRTILDSLLDGMTVVQIANEKGMTLDAVNKGKERLLKELEHCLEVKR